MNLFSIFHCGAGRMDCIFRGTVLFFLFYLLGLEIVMTFFAKILDNKSVFLIVTQHTANYLPI
jgi:hypothetical protein